MIIAWRIVKSNHAKTAFSGEGARIYGGRWNHKGTSLVYLGGSLALASLELFVHLGKAGANLPFVSFRVEIPKKLIADLPNLPRNWRQQPPPRSTKDAGTAWADQGKRPVLKVPSVLVPREHNYMLNVRHPNFGKIAIDSPEPFSFDPRMWNPG